jgi:prepilin-type N-terminal cleavage/methylation domain-containing protein
MSRYRGFTLVELLVALTIVALIAGLLTSSMGFSLNTAETVEARILDNESLHAAQRAFRRQVQLARPVVVESGSEDVRLAFAASASQLDFVAPLPGLTLGGLLHHISMRFDADSGQLLMEFVPYLDDSRDGEDAFAVHQAVLIDGLENAEFSYLDTLGAASGTWLPEWRDAGRLPDLVRLSLSFDEQGNDGDIEFIVAVKATLPLRTGDT